jgi:hypothetical protein
MLFFAICWGTSTNAQPRWKAFAWAYLFDEGPPRPSLRRCLFALVIALVIMNVFAFAYFAYILSVLPSIVPAGKAPHGITPVAAFLSVLPALGAFGFYRLWFAVIQLNPNYFYDFPTQAIPNQRYPDEEKYPGLTQEDLNPVRAWWHLWIA